MPDPYQDERRKEVMEAIYEVILGNPMTQEDSRKVIERFIEGKKIGLEMSAGKKWRIILGRRFALTLNDYKI